ncbi:unnamed protein product [Symbiodinium necroappetens]|uniref:Uncharacterized protein n=1 Tax=Symbiodinium necroappetens TaxID=1628268 RepID=A0A812PLU3_9DINO|nr:unnamed protein product [Symbiodinium necroappetens]
MDRLAQVGARRVDNLAGHMDVLQRLNVNRSKEEQGDIVMWLPHENESSSIELPPRFRFPLCIVQKHLIVKNETWNRVLDVVSWSFRFVSLQQVCFRYVDTMARRGMLQTAIVPACKAREPAQSLVGFVLPPGEVSFIRVSFFHLSIIQLDWLHVVDLGMNLEFLGGTFKHIIDHHLEGSSFADRCKRLHREMRWCSTTIANRLAELKPTMLRQDKPFAKLRAKAAEARCLVPFVVVLCQALLDPTDEFEMNLLAAAQAFDACYRQVTPEIFEQQDLANAGAQFANRYVWLSARAKANDWKLFRIKPKLHMFCELTYAAAVCPSTSWTYRDEDFGGKAALLAARRSGKNSAVALGRSFFKKFACLHEVPSL